MALFSLGKDDKSFSRRKNTDLPLCKQRRKLGTAWAPFNSLLAKLFFRRFSGHNLRWALFVYRLIGATLIGNFIIPS